MDEADRILIESLISIGLEVTDSNLNLEDFSPDILINATGLCLEYIFESKNEPQSFPKSCPINIGSRFKVGQTLSDAIKSLGYKDSIGYQAFLYPNIKDTRKIISFLIETLPKETGPSGVERLNETNDINQIIKNTFSANWLSPWLPHYCRVLPVSFSQYSIKSLLIPFQSDRKPSLDDWFNSFPTIDKQVDNRFNELLILAMNYEMKTQICENINHEKLKKLIKEINSTKPEQIITERLNQSKPEVRKRTKFIEKKTQELENVEPTEQTIEEAENEYEITEEKFNKIVSIYNALLNKFDKLNEKFDKLSLRDKELDLEIESEKVKSTTRRKIALILSNGEENLEKLEMEIAKRRTQIGNIERQWEAHKSELNQEIQSIQEQKRQKQTRTNQLEFQLADVKQQMESLQKNFREKTSEIKSLDEKVKQIINQQTKQQNRNEFTKRILELTENKKKQKEEIKKILNSIFDLQKEINGLRGKLDRSFVEARDFMLNCSLRKDETAKKMHAALLGIHENCSDLVSVIEEKGRLIREIREIDTNIENENKEDVEKNLEKITADYNEAKQNCDSLKKLLKDYKRNQQAVQ